ARRAVTGTLARTASRVMSCQKASLWFRSTSRFASRSSPTGASRSDADRPSQFGEGKRSTKGSSDSRGVARLVGQSAESLAHPHLHAPGELAVDQVGMSVDEPDPVFLLQPEQGFDDEERVAVA